MYQNLDEIYAHLEKSREKMLATLENLPPDSAHWREGGTGWTISEIVEHLSMVEERMFKAVRKLLAEAQKNSLPPSALPPIPAEFFARIEAARDSKREAPEAVRPHSEQTLADSLARLKESRRQLAALRTEAEKVDASAPTLPHPMLGDLNLYQWLFMIGLHERRHCAQIERILHSN